VSNRGEATSDKEASKGQHRSK